MLHRFVLFCVVIAPLLQAQPGAPVISPAKMPRLGEVDERFLSYNIEMVEVIGGRFWKPYGQKSSTTSPASQPSSDSTPAGMDPNLYQYRAPIDLSNSRLRKLSAGLGPAYVRVSGTWANSVYFFNSDKPAPEKAPSGFSGILTRKEWKGVIDFAGAVNGAIVTSFATSPGPRDRNGIWNPEQARELVNFTRSSGARIAAAEFMNEPTYAAMGGAPKGYDAAAFGRDVKVFRTFLKEASPQTLLLGPGSVGEGPFAMAMGTGMLKSDDLLKATGAIFDVFSYHLYAAASVRCASAGPGSQTTAADALSKEWLSRPEKINAFYSNLRNQYEAGKPLWITETADAACGGNPWASTFLDTFRYLVEHARLAQLGVSVIMHNTLASSDYGLLDQNTYEPRPNYWATLLWHKLMGTIVLDPGRPPDPNVYLFAHCMKDHPGGVSLLIVNADRQRKFNVNLATEFFRYVLTASRLEDRSLQLNGRTLRLGTNDDLPQLTGDSESAGPLSVAAESIVFVTIPNAQNHNCEK